MKNVLFLCKRTILLIGIMLLCLAACSAGGAGRRDGLSAWGRLSVRGTELCAQDGTPIVLRGMSSHGLAWFPEYTNYAALKTLRDYGANVFRIAVYPDQNNGYLEEPELNEKLLYAAVENALAADLYAVVDWHVLRDENPQKHRDEARAFFEKAAQRYGKEPGVLYEICNEPNGETTYEDIAAYAAEIIPVIRKYAPDAVILVGTPKFCTTLEEAVENPLPYENVMYTYHYYSDVSDCRYARSQIDKALENGIPVFVSEWGYEQESQTVEEDIEALDTFLDFLEEREISWINWSLSNKAESYSFIAAEEKSLSGWTEEQLTASGKYTVSRLKGRP